jgi:hypothetical protein
MTLLAIKSKAAPRAGGMWSVEPAYADVSSYTHCEATGSVN